jgi:predicted  nucleic acid-binding Zn-ribbon protein
MATKYQVTELDRALQQFKGIDEWTNEKQLRHRLEIKEKTIDKLNEEIEELKQAIHLYHDELKKREETHKHIVPNLQAWKDRHADTIKEYDKLKSEVHSDIEKVWMFDATLTKDLSAYHKRKRNEAIERVFYKIANQWID